MQIQTDKVRSTLTSLSQTKATSASSSEMSSQITGTGFALSHDWKIKIPFHRQDTGSKNELRGKLTKRNWLLPKPVKTYNQH